MIVNKPNFFILGAPKCGTTSMYYWLKQHSKIYFPEVKEPHYFSSDLKPTSRMIKIKSQYLKLYKHAKEEHKILGDASVFHLFSKTAVGNILSFNGNAKFLVMLRNPIDMAVSLHQQYLFSGNEIFEKFEHAWQIQDDRFDDRYLSKNIHEPKLLHYGKVCSLGGQLLRLFDKVDKEKVKLVFLDDLKNSPKNILNEIFLFLDLPDEEINTEIKNEARFLKNYKFKRFIKSVNRLKRRLGVPKMQTKIGKFILDLNIKKMNKPEIDLELRYNMVAYFENDIKLLMDLTERDLTHWLKV